MDSRSTSSADNAADVYEDLHREKEITDGRSRLAVCPSGHPERADACASLAYSLYDRYQVTGRETLLDEIITLDREALALWSPGHPDRALPCQRLGVALRNRYHMTGSATLLDEAITLDREALSLRSAEHPEYAHSCNNLGLSLQACYDSEVTGSSTLLDEAIVLYREALSLRPANHPHRAFSCRNLGRALHACYEATGVSALLDEAIALLREAMALWPAGHPYHAISCNSLAYVLHDRYRVTGSATLLDETITLNREALALCPIGHSNLSRASSCHNLANALYGRYEVIGCPTLLDEAITLHREALALRPAGNLYRVYSCNNLGIVLQARYKVTGVSALLDEAITLYRESKTLRPTGHPHHALSCRSLAIALWHQYRKTRDVSVLDEALALIHESATSTSPSDSWRILLLSCSIHLENGSPHFSISTATEYLSQVSIMHPNNIPEFMHWMQDCLTSTWFAHDTWTADTSLLLSDVYSNLIDKLSRMTGFELDTASQLTVLRSARSFGSDACIAALMADRPGQAVELFDHAHGMIWAQALHQRDPQLQGLPENIAFELETLLRAASTPVTAEALTSSASSACYLSREDVRYQQNSRIQTILTEVRAMPGLERFMLGKTYAQLRETAKEHSVVVLVSARGRVYALVIQNAAQDHPHVLHLDITTDRLSLLRDTAARAGLRQGEQGEAAVHDLEAASERAMRMSRHKEASPLATLADLWHGVVKPVVAHLQLRVRLRDLRLLLLS
jgi:tetratricopeptide (TPR) repeat protein